jgi:four helix bundle protein
MKCEKLEVWKISAGRAPDVYRQMAELTDYGFKGQITRAALSIPSNIAEGMEKEPGRDQVRFLDIAKGSAAEFATQTGIGMEIDTIPREIGASWVKTAQQITGMLTNLRKNLKAKHDS